MKTIQNASRTTKALLAGSFLALAIFVGLVEAARRGGPSPGDKLLPFIALLNSGQETAQPSSPALGVASLFLNQGTSELTYNISYQGLVAPEVGSHIHGPATLGVNASILIDFMNLSNPKNGSAILTPQQVGLLKKGLLYVNIHTDPASGGFSGGEIRGQILPIKARYTFGTGS